jgi:hypothetical protein
MKSKPFSGAGGVAQVVEHLASKHEALYHQKNYVHGPIKALFCLFYTHPFRKVHRSFLEIITINNNYPLIHDITKV